MKKLLTFILLLTFSFNAFSMEKVKEALFIAKASGICNSLIHAFQFKQTTKIKTGGEVVGAYMNYKQLNESFGSNCKVVYNEYDKLYGPHELLNTVLSVGQQQGACLVITDMITYSNKQNKDYANFVNRFIKSEASRVNMNRKQLFKLCDEIDYTYGDIVKIIR